MTGSPSTFAAMAPVEVKAGMKNDKVAGLNYPVDGNLRTG
jgi:hypothetical protein